MLETPEERIKLLKAGYTGKAIEMLYIQLNNFKIACIPPIVELVECNIMQNKKTCIDSEMAVECEQSFFLQKELLFVKISNRLNLRFKQTFWVPVL